MISLSIYLYSHSKVTSVVSIVCLLPLVRPFQGHPNNVSVNFFFHVTIA